MTQMTRRELLKTLTGTSIAALIPASVNANTNTRIDSTDNYEGYVVELLPPEGTTRDRPGLLYRMISYNHRLGVASNDAWRFYRTREEAREYIDGLRQWYSRHKPNDKWLRIHTGKVVGWQVLRAEAPRNDSDKLWAEFPKSPKEELWVPNTHRVNERGENPRQSADWCRRVLMQSAERLIGTKKYEKPLPLWPIYWVEPVLEESYVSWFDPQDRQFYGRVWGSHV